MKFVWQISYPPANEASQGNYFLPEKRAYKNSSGSKACNLFFVVFWFWLDERSKYQSWVHNSKNKRRKCFLPHQDLNYEPGTVSQCATNVWNNKKIEWYQKVGCVSCGLIYMVELWWPTLCYMYCILQSIKIVFLPKIWPFLYSENL